MYILYHRIGKPTLKKIISFEAHFGLVPLFWFPRVTIEPKPNPQNYFEKKLLT